MAEVVFRDLVKRAGLRRQGHRDLRRHRATGTSASTRTSRTLAALAARGYDGSRHRAKQFDTEWFENLDLVVVFDRSQERIIRAWANTEADRSKVRLLLSFDTEQAAQVDVPDPYYSDAAMFDTVLGMIEKASAALFRQIEPGIRRVVS